MQNMAEFLGDARFPEKAMKENSRAIKIRYFQDLYRRYSQLEFSHIQDRPIAIAGLENRLRKAYWSTGAYGIFDDRPGHGLFHRSLLWQRSEDEGALKLIDFSFKPESAAPTWSWMAHEGGIDYLDPPFQQMEWEETEIEPPWTVAGSGESHNTHNLRVVARPFNVAGHMPGDVKFVYDNPGRERGSGEHRAMCVVVAKERGDKPTFRETSIFRPPPNVLGLDLQPEPEFQLYDNFGKSAPMPGIATFAHLNWTNCFTAESDGVFDVGIVGMPFDLGVSYRPGQRFGPAAARTVSQRMGPSISYSMAHDMLNPFRSWATVVDCGDIANSLFDKFEAVQELGQGLGRMASRVPKTTEKGDNVRLITIGGDHTITLPSLRALHSVWGEVAVIHFDAHLDTWNPRQWGGGVNKYDKITHGTLLHFAHEEGLLKNDSSIHVGVRALLFDETEDLRHDAECGFQTVMAADMDSVGVAAIVERIVNRVGDNPAYVTIDIDVLDAAFAPATGCTEIGGWTTRELAAVLRGLSAAGVRIIGADIAELSPVYDNVAQTTATAVAQLVFEILVWMVRVPVKKESTWTNLEL
ncbi:putative agmatinase 1 [Colletotrichum higginsianum]|uniref:Putative agmatinase 1 n=1 Tax=Colletotrichum higginsianum TaxID=80884 RepID=A0A4V4NA44_9PEZI|nr:putative agmatinase 1 [Colletotrichum higginsianum]